MGGHQSNKQGLAKSKKDGKQREKECTEEYVQVVAAASECAHRMVFQISHAGRRRANQSVEHLLRNQQRDLWGTKGRMLPKKRTTCLYSVERAKKKKKKKGKKEKEEKNNVLSAHDFLHHAGGDLSLEP
jgi:hypothetical protein